MKTKMGRILGLGILLGGMMAAPLAVMADTSTNEPLGDLIYQHFGSVTNIAVNPYATYAPKSPHAKIGGGIFTVVNLNPQSTSVQVGAGLGLDWLGQFSLVSADMSFQLPFHPLPNEFPNFQVAPAQILGVATAYSGDGKFNGNVSAVTDTGFYFKFGHLWKGEFDAGIFWGKWVGTGPYDVSRYHASVGYAFGF